MSKKEGLPHTNQVMDEQQLVAGLRNRDTHAMGYLYDRYAGALYGVVLRIVKREALAEDVMQESFVKIWKHIDGFDSGKGRLFTWLIQICRNTARDKIKAGYHKRMKNAEEWDQYIIKHQERHAGSFNIDCIGLRELVMAMKPQHRTIIDLMYFEGYTQKEVAEKLSLPLGTVKTRCRAALKELRKLSVDDRH